MAVLPTKLVAVVVPLSNREELTADEEMSLKHLIHFLGKYDKYFVMPEGLEFSRAGFGIKRFDNKYFGTVEAHRKLMLSPRFYKSFRDYVYILIYHLDSLVFSDQLMKWCETGLDYVGAPWIGVPGIVDKVGNGGFSLRKVDSFLKVIYSRRYFIDPDGYWEENYASKPIHRRLINLPKKGLMHLNAVNNARRKISLYVHNEDAFWANWATYFYPAFRIASIETALSFAFECFPSHCFELNNRILPFGCHAWHKYEREFWEPYLLK
jgi:hypothetical protein